MPAYPVQAIVEVPDPTVASVAGLQGALDGKADVGHTHPGAGSGFKTVLDFGAVGDNAADDAPAFNAALAWSEENVAPVLVPNLVYKIGAPISVTTLRNHERKWGLIGLGGILLPAYGNAALHFISVCSRHYDRFFELSGLTLRGSRLTGAGVHLAAKEVSGAAGNFSYSHLHNLAIEGFKDGVFLEGNVFEMVLAHIHSGDNADNGFRFTHSAFGGVCSAIWLKDFSAYQNGGCGVKTEASVTDVNVSTGYIRNNQSYGLSLDNGCDKVIENIGFENNYVSQSFGETSAHIHTRNKANFRNISAYNGYAAKGAKYLIRKTSAIGGDMMMQSCKIKNSGGGQPTALASLAGAGHTYLLRCDGEIVAASPALYTADFCTGAGLNSTGRVTNVA